MKNITLFLGVFLVVFIFCLTTPYAQTSSDEYNELQQIFNSSVTKKDGKLSKAEFMAKCKGKNCNQRFDALDTNKDGFLDKAEIQRGAGQGKEKSTGPQNFKKQ